MKNQVKNNLEESKNCTTKYLCDKCKDTTYILLDEGAIPCSCKEIREAERILEQSGISKEFSKKSFQNFDYSRNVQTINAYTMARNYVNNFVNIRNYRENSVIFMGRVGSGKTHLSIAIANELIKNGIGVVYMGYRSCITKIKQNVMDKEVYEKLINRYKECKVLLVDDLFKGSITQSDINIFYEVIEYRYFNNLPVIISCEKGRDELLKIDEAIGSRILEMCGNSNIELKGGKLNYRSYK